MSEEKIDHPIADMNCPICGASITGAADIAGEPGRAPEPGDALVCIKCASVNTLLEDQTLRQLTRAELDEFPLVETLQIRRVQEGILALKAKAAVNN